MNKAIKLFVRGFHTQEVGDKFIETLENIGFRIEVACDGKGDDLGGLIETQITEIDQLDPCTIKGIRQTLYGICPDNLEIFIQYRLYRLVKDHTL